MDKAVSVRNVTKTYAAGEAAVRAVRHINLDVAHGEVMLLMGPSGSGKTTLLSIMGCILRPSSGSVRVHGREVTGLNEKELPRIRLDHFGFIFQGFNLFPTLTAGENVEVALDLKGLRDKVARHRAAELLEQVGLSDKYRTFPYDLSGGQKQRVAIARALASDPDIILADEPTGALDWHSGRTVLEMLRRLARQERRAVVIVTHDSRALEFADRIVHLEDGRIKGDDASEISSTAIGGSEFRGTMRTQPEDGTKAAQGNREEVGMKRKSGGWIVSLAVLAIVVTLFAMTHGRASQSSPPAEAGRVSQPDSKGATRADDAMLVVGPGRVEPISEDIKVGSELNGKLKAVLVDEGDRVRQGQVLAVLVNDDYRAQLAVDEAAIKEKEAELRKTINGARGAERREAMASVNEARAVMENARTEMERRQQLAREGVISQSEEDLYEREYNVAKARYDAAAQHFAFIDEPAREEDRSRAEADVSLARAQTEEDRARYEKTFIRAPLDAVILRRYHRLGESVTNSSIGPDPLFALGNTHHLRVRVDVDEADVARLHLGQRAYVTADAFGSRKFWGHVVRIGGELGKKNIRTDEPTERVDTKILETLVDLDDGSELPIGLRVDAFIVPQ